MKTAYITIALCLLATVPAFSQDRARYSFDNFDTSLGVQVYRNPTFVPVGAKNKTAAPKTSGKRFVQPTALVTPARQATSRMNVSEGLADREIGRTTSFNSNFNMPAGSASLKGFTTGDPM